MVQTARFELANPKILHIGAVSTQLLPAYCSLRAEPKPRPSGKKGEKKKNGDAEFAPASPMIKCVFSIFPLLSGIFKIYFSAISTTQG